MILANKNQQKLYLLAHWKGYVQRRFPDMLPSISQYVECYFVENDGLDVWQSTVSSLFGVMVPGTFKKVFIGLWGV